jgi:hypothetical protein
LFDTDTHSVCLFDTDNDIVCLFDTHSDPDTDMLLFVLH